jgi:hypothetical protein
VLQQKEEALCISVWHSKYSDVFTRTQDSVAKLLALSSKKSAMKNNYGYLSVEKIQPLRHTKLFFDSKQCFSINPNPH